ncbi:phosphatase PAP2 family protein [Candidatus Gottesmanbacteria bacterium]|nr:phosphatase PAP2 family protein [Candidatus Gottesmanbacteria bacterium]
MYIVFIRFVSEYLVFLLLLPIFYFLKKRDYQTCLKIFISVAITYLLRKVAGSFWYEQRPFIIDSTKLLYPTALTVKDNSFFSGHAAIAMATAGTVFWKYKKMGLILIGLAVAVGMGRVLAGLHYEIDVMVGFFVGFLVSYLIKILFHRLDI